MPQTLDLDPQNAVPVPGPPCPNCKGDNTVRTHRDFAESFYYCPDCDHRWSEKTTRSEKQV